MGRVGEGKSSLISAILGEMEKISGHVNVKVGLNNGRTTLGDKGLMRERAGKKVLKRNLTWDG